MRSTSENEAFVYEAVKSGALEIRPDGTVWRVAEERGNRWNDLIKIVPVEPRRLAAKPPPTSKYLTIKVMRRGRQVLAGLHRLVYLHFVGPIPPGLTINHKDGDPTNNRPSNLELATYTEQVKHSIEVLGRQPKDQLGERNAMAKLNETAVREIRTRRSAGEKLKSIAADFDVSDKTISKIARGERWEFLG